MPVLYFVRHAQTEWNLQRRFQGQSGDSPLLPSSIADIDKLADFLIEKNISKVYSSPIKRAKTTTELLCEKLLIDDFSLDERLKEINFGDWEGQKYQEINAKTPQLYQRYQNQPEKFDFKQINGEGYQNVQSRFKSFVNDILEQNDQSVLIVSHGAALQAAISGLLGKPIAKIKELGGLSNLSTTALEVSEDREIGLLYWNQTNYLGSTQNFGNTLQ